MSSRSLNEKPPFDHRVGPDDEEALDGDDAAKAVAA